MAQAKSGAAAVDGRNDLNGFLQSFASLPEAVKTGMLGHVTDEDERAMMGAFAASLEEQVGKLCKYVETQAKSISRQAAVAVTEVLEVSGALVMTNQAHGLAKNLAAPTARLGLAGIIDMIKKVIRALLSAFDIGLPKWVDKILDIINEILHWLLSGGNAPFRITLSKLHQNYLAELAQLARLERESQWQLARANDED